MQEAFPRSSRLSRLEITPRLAPLGLGGRRRAPASPAGGRFRTWTRPTGVSVLKRNGRSGPGDRATAGAAVFLLAVGVWRLLATRHSPRGREDDPDFSRVRAILAAADCAGARSSLGPARRQAVPCSPVGRQFMHVRVRGRSWNRPGIAGRQARRAPSTCSALPRTGRLASARPGVYGVGPEDLARHGGAGILDPERSASPPPCPSTASPWKKATGQSAGAAGARPAEEGACLSKWWASAAARL